MKKRFVYFDLGNVLVHFDPHAACRQVAAVLGSDPATIQAAMYDSGIEVQLESGEISEDEFLDQLFARVGCSADRGEVLEAMSAMFWLNTSMLPVVARLRAENIPMGILSNTCGPHWNWIMRQNFGLIRMIGPIATLSFEVGAMKPDPQIYAAAEQIAGVAGEDILFIDDRSENVQGAIDCGWQAVPFSSTRNLLVDLRRHGLRCFV